MGVEKGLDSAGSKLINKYSLSKTANCGTKGSDEKNSSNKFSLGNTKGAGVNKK